MVGLIKFIATTNTYNKTFFENCNVQFGYIQNDLVNIPAQLLVIRSSPMFAVIKDGDDEISQL